MTLEPLLRATLWLLAVPPTGYNVAQSQDARDLRLVSSSCPAGAWRVPLAILNDDDVWERDLLAKLVAPLESNSDCVLATSDHWIMDESGRIDVGLSRAWSVNFGRASLQEGIVSNAAEFAVAKGGPAINISSVFRKDAIDWSLMVRDISGAYDYWVSCLLAATRRPIYYVPERLARWRAHLRDGDPPTRT